MAAGWAAGAAAEAEPSWGAAVGGETRERKERGAANR